MPGAGTAAAPAVLPEPGTMVSLSPAYRPAMIKGLTVHKDNPFMFDFIVDIGQDNLTASALEQEGEKLIKYFLASLAIPERDLWVNLSPYEHDRTIPEALSRTEMGRDLLAQDYLLKQITASLIYPEHELGKNFWDRVYQKSQELFGSAEVPVNTFNKVWILADKAEVFERNQTVVVVSSHFKVMLEEDYLAVAKRLPRRVTAQEDSAKTLAKRVLQEIVLPELEKEVNEGKNFSQLRQIFNSLILANWYKKNLKSALLSQVYVDKSQVEGIDLKDPAAKERIYNRYMDAYKKGVFNFIKEDRRQGQILPRKYFSGGIKGEMVIESVDADAAMASGAFVGLLKKFKTRLVTKSPAPTIEELKTSTVPDRDWGRVNGYYLLQEIGKSQAEEWKRTRDKAMLGEWSIKGGGIVNFVRRLIKPKFEKIVEPADFLDVSLDDPQLDFIRNEDERRQVVNIIDQLMGRTPKMSMERMSKFFDDRHPVLGLSGFIEEDANNPIMYGVVLGEFPVPVTDLTVRTMSVIAAQLNMELVNRAGKYYMVFTKDQKYVLGESTEELKLKREELRKYLVDLRQKVNERLSVTELAKYKNGEEFEGLLQVSSSRKVLWGYKNTLEMAKKLILAHQATLTEGPLLARSQRVLERLSVEIDQRNMAAKIKKQGTRLGGAPSAPSQAPEATAINSLIASQIPPASLEELTSFVRTSQARAAVDTFIRQILPSNRLEVKPVGILTYGIFLNYPVKDDVTAQFMSFLAGKFGLRVLISKTDGSFYLVDKHYILNNLLRSDKRLIARLEEKRDIVRGFLVELSKRTAVDPHMQQDNYSGTWLVPELIQRAEALSVPSIILGTTQSSVEVALRRGRRGLQNYQKAIQAQLIPLQQSLQGQEIDPLQQASIKVQSNLQAVDHILEKFKLMALNLEKDRLAKALVRFMTENGGRVPSQEEIESFFLAQNDAKGILYQTDIRLLNLMLLQAGEILKQLAAANRILDEYAGREEARMSSQVLEQVSRARKLIASMDAQSRQTIVDPLTPFKSQLQGILDSSLRRNGAGDRVTQITASTFLEEIQEVQRGLASQAQISAEGGIDLKTPDIRTSKDGSGVEVTFDPAMVERIRKTGLESLVPRIYSIISVPSVWPLLGMTPAEVNNSSTTI